MTPLAAVLTVVMLVVVEVSVSCRMMYTSYLKHIHSFVCLYRTDSESENAVS
jgi:hypothetical protein